MKLIQLEFLKFIQNKIKPINFVDSKEINSLAYYLYKFKPNSIFRYTIDYINTINGPDEIKIIEMKKNDFYYLVELTNENLISIMNRYKYLPNILT